MSPVAWITLAAAIAAALVGERVEAGLLATWLVVQVVLRRGGGQWHLGAFGLAFLAWIDVAQREQDPVGAVTVALAVLLAAVEDAPGGRIQPLAFVALALGIMGDRALQPVHVALVQLVVGPIEAPPRARSVAVAAFVLMGGVLTPSLEPEVHRALGLCVAFGWGAGAVGPRAGLGVIAVLLLILGVPAVRDLLELAAPTWWAALIATGVPLARAVQNERSRV